nr:hypothetical protein [Cytophagales bacterium]
MKNILKKLMPSCLFDVIKELLSFFGQKTEKVSAGSQIFSNAESQIFFGYYDVTPFSSNDRYLLATRAPKDNVSPHVNHPDLELGYYDLEKKNPVFTTFAKSKTWNWQQGCRLQWHNENVLYNTLIDNQYVSIIQNPLSGEIIKTFEKPVYSANKDFGLTLDFDRLHACRPGYGYNYFPEIRCDDKIWFIDFATGEISEMLTIEAVKAFLPLPTMQAADHYFNHLSISPKGTRFMVTHLWVSPAGKRYSRMIVCDFQNENTLSCPNNSGHTSHYCWDGEDKIILFGTQESHGQRYYAHDLKNNETSALGPADLREDGHPSYLKNNILITDTYPNYLRQQNLLRYDIEKEELRKIASFHVPVSFSGEVRCDLHPRPNKKGDKVCVDIVRNGQRAMCVVKN